MSNEDDDCYYNLGRYTRDISTASKDAQSWFNRGLIWIYGYNHEEAIACFRKALEEDPKCVMAQWGIAYAIGPNYNKPWDTFEPDEKVEALKVANDAIQAAKLALAEVDHDSSMEASLIDAIQHRYPTNTEHATSVEDFGSYSDSYANAMRQVYKDHPNDLDIISLFAEALMTRTPWQLWELSSGEPALGADTLEAVQVLETAFSTNSKSWNHPGLLHMYIHLMEMSPFPERALRQGDRLLCLVPDSGHLIHMPTHVDVLCGDYERVVSRNLMAIEADRKVLAKNGIDHFYSIYILHNFHFVVYGAMFLGQPSVALEAANELMELVPESLLKEMGDWFEAFIPMKQHVLIRFGMWKDILEQDLPQNDELYCFTTAVMRYARTVALANLGDIEGAEAEREEFYKARDAVPESRMLFNNTCRDVLKVAEQMMLGELAYHKGEHEKAFEHLCKSIQLDDNLPYDEPWGWMQPTRHALGALLLEQGHVEEAEAVYRADLGLEDTLSRACQHPRNVWSLHGLFECLSKRNETVEAQHVKRQLDQAVARAEVPIRSSCYCRGRSNHKKTACHSC